LGVVVIVAALVLNTITISAVVARLMRTHAFLLMASLLSTNIGWVTLFLANSLIVGPLPLFVKVRAVILIPKLRFNLIAMSLVLPPVLLQFSVISVTALAALKAMGKYLIPLSLTPKPKRKISVAIRSA